MAFETGTATSHTDLWSKLKTFLTTNVDLVADNQEWTEVWSTSATEFVLRGPGLAEQDQVYLGFKRYDNAVTDQYWIQLYGMTGIIGTATAMTGHVNVSKHVRMFLDSGAMTYWFVASGRRVIVVIKISTVFQALYGGLILPYGTPIDYPYPLFIGGSTGMTTGYADSWRSTHGSHRLFTSSYYDTSPVIEPGAWLLDPSGAWLRVTGKATAATGNVVVIPERAGTAFDWNADAGNGPQMQTILARLGRNFGGSMTLVPVTLVQYDPTDQTFGILDGISRPPSYENASQNTITTVDSVPHLVVQNVFRAELGEYMTVALE